MLLQTLLKSAVRARCESEGCKIGVRKEEEGGATLGSDSETRVLQSDRRTPLESWARAKPSFCGGVRRAEREGDGVVPASFPGAMTCSAQAGRQPTEKGSCGMGASGSAFPSGRSDCRLKGRSQSSSALHGPPAPRRERAEASRLEEEGAWSGGRDVWELPPNSSSFSPGRQRRRGPRKDRLRQIPVLEAIFNLHRKGGRKCSVGRRGVSEEENTRNKLYAVSCPDVTEHGKDDLAQSVRRGVECEGGLGTSQPLLCRRKKSLDPAHEMPQEWWKSERDGAPLTSRNAPINLDDPSTSTTFPLISEENIFQVFLERDERGLGLGFSVSGGADAEVVEAGLVRVKNIFPMGPAFQSGLLRPNDLLLKANGRSLIGLTNHEALEVLRTTPKETLLTVCRPPVPSSRGREHCPLHGPTSGHSFKSKSLSSLPTSRRGEFEVTLEKVGGSLGFTIREDDLNHFHFVRELVKEPALGDGRIRAGDRILSVNSVDLEGMNHSETVAFLRSCPHRVKLRLYRDPASTPPSPLSPQHAGRHGHVKDKTFRQEAMDMIQDMKERKQMSTSPEGGRPSPPGLSRGYKQAPTEGSCPTTLPKRRPAHTAITPSPEVISAALDRFAGRSTPKGLEKSCPGETRGSGSGESTPANTLSSKSKRVPGDAAEEGLGLRKPSFRQLTLHLDRIASLEDDSFSSDFSHEEERKFRPGQPAYQSAALPPLRGKARGRRNLSLRGQGGGRSGMNVSAAEATMALPQCHHSHHQSTQVSGGDGGRKELSFLEGELPERRSPDGRAFDEGDALMEISEGSGGVCAGEVLTVELSRKWSSRLGFSLQGSEGRTFVSAIYADSVAGRDGRIQQGDEILMVNNESVRNMATTEVIDMMRKTRGMINITLFRTQAHDTSDCESETPFGLT